MRADLIPEAYQVKHNRRELRELTRGRQRMIQWRGKLQSTLWNQASKYNVQISGSQWRYLERLQRWLQPQLPPIVVGTNNIRGLCEITAVARAVMGKELAKTV